MSIRKRTWTTHGLKKSAWVVDYFDQSGTRRLKTFDRKKDAEDFEANSKVEIKAGIHTADSASITVTEAGERWIAACINAKLERTTVDSYRQHLNLHIKPFLGRRKLSELTIPIIKEFETALQTGTDTEKPRSHAMIKRVRSDLGALLSNAQEDGLIARNVVREIRSRRRRGKERQAEYRAKRKLRIGVDIPTPKKSGRSSAPYRVIGAPSCSQPSLPACARPNSEVCAGPTLTSPSANCMSASVPTNTTC